MLEKSAVCKFANVALGGGLEWANAAVLDNSPVLAAEVEVQVPEEKRDNSGRRRRDFLEDPVEETSICNMPLAYVCR